MPARAKSSPARRRDARELARTPVTNPYRNQLADPYAPATPDADTFGTSGTSDRPADFLLLPDRTQAGTRQPLAPTQPDRTSEPAGWSSWRAPGAYPTGRVRTPAAAGWATALGFINGGATALFGILLIAWISLQNQLGPDRSFHAGGDAADLLVGLLDLGLACAYLISAAAFSGGRVTGRIGLTAAGWTNLFISGYWWQSERNVPAWLPWSTALVTVVMLMLAYTPSVTRWLGVLPPPQPE